MQHSAFSQEMHAVEVFVAQQTGKVSADNIQIKSIGKSCSEACWPDRNVRRGWCFQTRTNLSCCVDRDPDNNVQ